MSGASSKGVKIVGGGGCCCCRPWHLLLCASLALAVSLLLLSRRAPPSPPDSRRRLPQAVVIGARKCGTRALLDFLSLHPRVAAAKEEVHFFDEASRVRLGLDWYRRRMPASRDDQVTVEKSPAYFVTEGAPSLMRRMNSSLRIVLILRDPVTRVVSDFAQLQHRRSRLGKSVKTLEQTVLNRRGRVNARSRMVAVSMYHKHLRRWLRFFPAEQIHLVDGDNLAVRPHEELQRVEEFLGLPAHIGPQHFVFNATKGFYCARQDGGQRCLGSDKGRRHPPVSPLTLAKLRRFFGQHDGRLVELVGRRFRWMRQEESQ